MNDVAVSTTSHFDVVIPNNNEQAFIDVALSLGYLEIVFLTSNLNYIKPSDSRILIKTAYLIRDKSEIIRARKRFDYVFASANRKFFETSVDFIINSEISDRKDSFHYRATSLNQVHAKLAQKNNLCIIFSFENSLSNKINLGKLRQNMRISKKYALRVACFSMATTPVLMRSAVVLEAFLRDLAVCK